MRQVEIYPDRDALMRAAATQFVAASQRAVESRGRFAVALSGGSTPRGLYELLAVEPLRSRVDWASVHVFWGDERAVSPDHESSNFRMAEEALLRKVPLPLQNVHRIRAELPPEQAAADYERVLRDFFLERLISACGTFDLVLLGMGNDGHTASLFPGTAAIHERDHWAAAHYVTALEAWRITLTPPVLNAARLALFLVSGSDKAEALRQVLDGPHQPDVLPAQAIRPTSGDVTWMLDVDAAALCRKSPTTITKASG